MKNPITDTTRRSSDTMTCLFMDDSNNGWDIYQDDKGALWSISHTDPKGDSHFGTMGHVLRLMGNGYFTGKTATEAGLNALSGACTALPDDYFQRVAHYAKIRQMSPMHHFRVNGSVPLYAEPAIQKAA